MHRPLQLTLDFFDSVAAEPPVQGPAAKPPVTGTRPGPRTGERNGTPVSTLVAPTPRLDTLLQPAAFRHPRANRETVLGGSLIAFEFRRTRRRNIGFMVGPEGLTVSAPKWVPLHEVDAAVRSKSPWILRKLGDVHDRQRRLDAARIEWREGATFPYMGEPVAVQIDSSHAFGEVGAVLREASPADGGPRHSLHVGVARDAQPTQIRDAVQAWLMRQAKRVFTERLDHYAPQLNVQWRKLALSNAATRWGTAHSDGLIRLNWRLIHFRLPVIDYVVAHELSHLRVMDHSPRFWETVATVVPDHENLRRQLKEEALPPW